MTPPPSTSAADAATATATATSDEWTPSVAIPAGVVATFVFIGSELALFMVPWLSLMYVSLIRPQQGTSFTDAFGHALEPRIPLIGTGLLLAGSVTMQMAVRARRERGWVLHPRVRARALVAVTALCGSGFIVLQAREFLRLVSDGLGPTSSVFAAAFFALVGLHGVHVTGGVLSQLAQLPGLRPAGNCNGDHDRGDDGRTTLLDASTWYWHFVDVMWLAILGIVYVPQFFR